MNPAEINSRPFFAEAKPVGILTPLEIERFQVAAGTSTIPPKFARIATAVFDRYAKEAALHRSDNAGVVWKDTAGRLVKKTFATDHEAAYAITYGRAIAFFKQLSDLSVAYQETQQAQLAVEKEKVDDLEIQRRQQENRLLALNVLAQKSGREVVHLERYARTKTKEDTTRNGIAHTIGEKATKSALESVRKYLEMYFANPAHVDRLLHLHNGK